MQQVAGLKAEVRRLQRGSVFDAGGSVRRLSTEARPHGEAIG